MKTKIHIPKFLHELFGTQQNRSELVLIILFTITSTLLVAWFTASYWLTLAWYQSLVLWLLFLDITGGVVANLSEGTNDYYNTRPKARWLFIAIHIQPLILAVVLESPIYVALVVWFYTVISASIINRLRSLSFHRLLAGAFFATAIIVYMLSGVTLPIPITLFYLLYMLKVICSFAVDHTGITT
ncbi:MAG: hypothetical protein Q8N92_10890 [Erysipelotrichaceae bacterium]|nr:hypothetical protein [Erysipelotrichaceae bacterium]